MKKLFIKIFTLIITLLYYVKILVSKALAISIDMNVQAAYEPDSYSLATTVKKTMNIITFTLFGICLLIFFYGLIKFIINNNKLKKFDLEHNLRQISKKEKLTHMILIIHNWLIFIGFLLMVQRGLNYYPILKYIPIFGIILLIYAFIMRLILHKKYKLYKNNAKELIEQKLGQLNQELIQLRENLYKKTNHYNRLAAGALFFALIIFFWYLITNFVVCC